MAVDVHSEKLRDLVDENAEVEQIATGFTFTEGPIWMKDGSLHFSDMPADKRRRWHPEEGVYRIPAGGGDLQLLVDDFKQPNGLCFSPDESLLYVNDTERAHIRVFDVGPDHQLSNGRVFAENIGDGDLAKGVVDGMKIDERGDVYVTGPEGIWVFSPEGEHLGTIQVPEPTGNLNWGDDDWKSLYIPSSTSIYRVRMKVGGNRLGYMH